MRKLVLTTWLCIFLSGCLYAQVSVFFDTSVPNGGPKYNLGGRLALFNNLDPQLQYGITLRAHRLKLERAEQPNEMSLFHEISMGFGIRYLFIKTPNHIFYVNPNVELNSFDEDEGLDLSANLGYIKRLSNFIDLNVEAGVRNRMAGYASPQALNDRTRFYLSAGVSLQLTKIFGMSDPILDR